MDDNSSLTVNVCDSVVVGTSIQAENPTGKCTDSALDHSHTVSTQLPGCFTSDHNYTMFQSPRALKRKASAAEVKLCAARKKLRMKVQMTKRLKARVSSLKHIIVDLQNKLLISSECASLLNEDFQTAKEEKSSLFSILEAIRNYAALLLSKGL